jgi:hypothetical protein
MSGGKIAHVPAVVIVKELLVDWTDGRLMSNLAFTGSSSSIASFFFYTRNLLVDCVENIGQRRPRRVPGRRERSPEDCPGQLGPDRRRPSAPRHVELAPPAAKSRGRRRGQCLREAEQ